MGVIEGNSTSTRVHRKLVRGVFGSVKGVKKIKWAVILSEKGVLQLTTRNHKKWKKKRREIISE